MGLPDVRYPDGTEVAPQLVILELRFDLDLYAGVRPVRVLAGAPLAARASRRRIDCVSDPRDRPRASSLARQGGSRRDGRRRCDTRIITRPAPSGSCDRAFELARRRAAAGTLRVTCVDKANVLPSMAFFRSIFDEVAARYPDIAADCMYVDATALLPRARALGRSTCWSPRTCSATSSRTSARR